MISTSDFKRGARLMLDGEPYTVEDTTTQTPSARGANTLVKAKLRGVLTGQLVQKTFKSGERFEEPDLENRVSQYLYNDPDAYYFMDQESFEQYAIETDRVADKAGYLVENLEVRILVFEGRPIAVEPPQTMELTIVDTEPAVRGDTVNAVTKAATLETGLVVQVPMFVESGTRIKVDTRDGRYLERAKG